MVGVKRIIANAKLRREGREQLVQVGQVLRPRDFGLDFEFNFAEVDFKFIEESVHGGFKLI